ncbi:MAG: 16S rRNA (adenine(1518)-N(6)/adenine(1519)-N(6))-dimethyltransferase RsmA [Alphaproteobacteria bacterium]|nr:16S rRNA (adenine(1518)-N(6)/adenine(1519)-N(6))-dimethyltransferase RsmA [Alphaproteobacteria bacterium]
MTENTPREPTLDADPVAALPPLREIVAASGLNALKSLGQHFLLDLNLTAKIAKLAGPLDEALVVEVGPGPGGLTRALLLAGARSVLALEKDRRSVQALSPLVDAAHGRLRVIETDALTHALAGLPQPIKIVANLPYNIGAPLLVGWLKQADLIEGMTLMFQKEVADRICAAPGGKIYGRLSVLCQWRCETRYAFTIPARAFTPPPKVDSAVVSLTPRTMPLSAPALASLETITGAAFGQRRKTLRKSLGALRDVDAADLIEAAEIDGGMRAEALDVAAFDRLARAYETLRAK